MPEITVLRNPLNPRGWWERKERVTIGGRQYAMAPRHRTAALAGWDTYKQALQQVGGKKVAHRRRGRHNPYDVMEFNPVELELNPLEGAYLENPRRRHHRRHHGRKHNPLEMLNPRSSRSMKGLFQGNTVKTIAGAAAGLVVTEKLAGSLNLTGWMKPIGSLGIAAALGIGGSQLDPQLGGSAALGGLVAATLQAVAQTNLVPDWVGQGSIMIGHKQARLPMIQTPLGSGAPKGALVYKP